MAYAPHSPISLCSNGSSTLARSRRKCTSTTLVSFSNFMSQRLRQSRYAREPRPLAAPIEKAA